MLHPARKQERLEDLLEHTSEIERQIATAEELLPLAGQVIPGSSFSAAYSELADLWEQTNTWLIKSIEEIILEIDRLKDTLARLDERLLSFHQGSAAA